MKIVADKSFPFQFTFLSKVDQVVMMRGIIIVVVSLSGQFHAYIELLVRLQHKWLLEC